MVGTARGDVAVVAVGDGTAIGDVCVCMVAVGDGTAMGDVSVVAVGNGVAVGMAVGATEGGAVGGGTVFVGSGLDCSQPAPQRLRASARVIRMKKRNLLGRKVHPLCDI